MRCYPPVHPALRKENPSPSLQLLTNKLDNWVRRRQTCHTIPLHWEGRAHNREVTFTEGLESGLDWLREDADATGLISMDTEDHIESGYPSLIILGTFGGRCLFIKLPGYPEGGNSWELPQSLRTFITNYVVLGADIRRDLTKLKLNARLAIDVLNVSSQIMRHPAVPWYNPEPTGSPITAHTNLKHLSMLLYGENYRTFFTNGRWKAFTHKYPQPHLKTLPSKYLMPQLYAWEEPLSNHQRAYCRNDAVSPFLHLTVYTQLELAACRLYVPEDVHWIGRHWPHALMGACMRFLDRGCPPKELLTRSLRHAFEAGIILQDGKEALYPAGVDLAVTTELDDSGVAMDTEDALYVLAGTTVHKVSDNTGWPVLVDPDFGASVGRTFTRDPLGLEPTISTVPEALAPAGAVLPHKEVDTGTMELDLTITEAEVTELLEEKETVLAPERSQPQVESVPARSDSEKKATPTVTEPRVTLKDRALPPPERLHSKKGRGREQSRIESNRERERERRQDAREKALNALRQPKSERNLASGSKEKELTLQSLLEPSLTTESLVPDRYREHPRLSSKCTLCSRTGKKRHNHYSECSIFKAQLRKYGPDVTKWDPLCTYPHCANKTTHCLALCPALHRRCPTCKVRGHDAVYCSVTTQLKRRVYERYMHEGVRSKRGCPTITLGDPKGGKKSEKAVPNPRFDVQWTFSPETEAADLPEVVFEGVSYLVDWNPSKIEAYYRLPDHAPVGVPCKSWEVKRELAL